MTLPNATAGFTFIITYDKNTPGGDTHFEPGSGTVKCIQQTAGQNTKEESSEARLICKNTNSKKGNSAIVTCDGTNWYVQAVALSNHEIFEAVSA